MSDQRLRLWLQQHAVAFGLFLERFLLLFGGSAILGLIPLVVASNGDDGRGWLDTIFTGDLALLSVTFSGTALLEAALAPAEGAWRHMKIIAVLCAAIVVLGGSMLYSEYSDNQLQIATAVAKGKVADASYVLCGGAFFAGLGSALVSTQGELRKRRPRARRSKGDDRVRGGRQPVADLENRAEDGER